MGPTKRLTPAEAVIATFGIRALARHLDLCPSTVWEWKEERPRGREPRDSYGLVPSNYHRAILDLAKRENKPEITADVLIYGRAA